MKKTRILAFLVTICMATTAFLGGTIAKYSTTEDIEDTATVADWGIQLKMSGSLFENAYNKVGSNDTGNDPAVAVTGDANGKLDDTSERAISVYSIGATNVVAPGTKGNILTISVTGKAEVDTKVTVSNKQNSAIADVYLEAGTYATMLKLGKITAQEFDLRKADLYTVTSDTYSPVGNNTYNAQTDYYFIQNEATVNATRQTSNDNNTKYYPVVYTLTKAGSTVNGILTAQDAYNSIKNDLVENADYKEYATNYNFSENNQFVYTLTWKWAIETDNDADTILGYLASNNADDNVNNDVIVVKLDGNNYVALTGNEYNLSTNFNISITVEQVD